MRSLGFGGSGHDWSCCLATEEGLLVSVDEERLTRLKYGVGADLLQSQARACCLAEDGLGPEDVDFAVACDLVPLPLAAPFRRGLVRIRHHFAHAYGAFLASPFDRAAILIADNSGSPADRETARRVDQRPVETLSYWQGEHGKVRELFTQYGTHRLAVREAGDYYQRGETDDSLGHLYAIVSEELGFVYRRNGSGAVTEDGKTMGLAAYGDDEFVSLLEPFIELLPEGRVRLRLADGSFRGLVRDLVTGAKGPAAEEFARRAAVARAAQQLLERALVHAAKHLHRSTGERHLVMAGGVALNCLANSRVARESGFEDLFILPAAGDNGTALGSALYGLVELGGAALPRDLNRRLPFLGPTRHLRTEAGDSRAELDPVNAPDVLTVVADTLAGEGVVAWFEGRSEFGPRALGHRSILADPRDPAMKDRINHLVKRREGFRPFAPMVLDRAVHSLFDVPAATKSSLPFMLVTGKVRETARQKIPAVVHVDGTSRVQVVDAERFGAMYRLLELFEERTGLPVLLNTSLNVAGQPIVETEAEAQDCVATAGIDLLYLNGRLLARKETVECLV